MTVVETLQRWTDSGALWRVLSRRGDTLTIGLFRCDGGEEVDRVVSSAPDLLAFIGDRHSSDD